MALTDNLFSYYKFVGNSTDSSGNGYNGTDTSITYGTTYGKIYQGALFNGTSSYISTPSYTSSGSLTINVWFKRGTGNGGILVGRDTSTLRCFYLNIDDTFGGGTLDFSTFNSSGTNYVNQAMVGVASYNTGWHMLTAIYESGVSSRIYLDGVLKSTTVVSLGIKTGSEAISIGRRNYSGSPIYWNGSLDELGTWNRAITTTEITQLYNGGSGLQYPFTTTTNNGAGFFMFL